MEEIHITGTTAEVIEQLVHVSSYQANQFMKESFVQHAMYALFKARRAAGLTQAEVAKRMHTRQPAIARYENDMDGSISLRRYIEFALACDMVPCDIVLVPVKQMVAHVARDANAPRTSALTIAWNSSIDDVGSITVKDSIFHSKPYGQQLPVTASRKTSYASCVMQGVA